MGINTYGIAQVQAEQLLKRTPRQIIAKGDMSLLADDLIIQLNL